MNLKNFIEYFEFKEEEFNLDIKNKSSGLDLADVINNISDNLSSSNTHKAEEFKLGDEIRTFLNNPRYIFSIKINELKISHFGNQIFFVKSEKIEELYYKLSGRLLNYQTRNKIYPK